jgi:hypothetical protein
LIIIILSITSLKPVKGIPEYSKILPQDLKPFCNVCHVKNSGGPLNSFGKDYKVYELNMLMEMDSDSDGFSNSDELAQNKFPGNPNSYPGKQRNNNTMIAAAVLAISVFLIIPIKFIKK